MMTKGMTLAVAGAVLGLATASQAAVMITDAGDAAFRDLSPGTAGMIFTVGGGNDLTVSSLGYIDEGLDGLAGSHQVGLWDSSGALVGEVTVSSGIGAALIGDFRYADLASAVTLTAGESYTLGAQTTGTDRFRDSSTTAVPTYDPLFTSIEARWTSDGTNGYMRPTNFGGGNGYVAPNMIFTVVPEPASLALLGLGGLLMTVRRRK